MNQQVRKTIAVVTASVALVATMVVGTASAGASSSMPAAKATTTTVAAPKVNATCTKSGDVDVRLICRANRKGKLVWADPTLPAGEYKIGMELPATGAAAAAGLAILAGAKLAVEEINATKFLGKGVTLTMLEKDSAGTVPGALSALDYFKANNVSGIICCGLSSQAGAIKGPLATASIPAVIDSAVLPNLTKLPWLYRTVLLMGLDGGPNTQLTKAVVAKYKVKKAVVVQTSDNQGMVDDAKNWSKALTDNKVTNSLVNTLAADTDLSSAATNIIAQNPDLVVNSQLLAPANRLIKALRDRGYTKPIMSNYGIADKSSFGVAGAALKNVIFPLAFWDQAPANKMATNFIKKMKAASGSTSVSIYNAQGYTAAYFLASGLKFSGDADPANVAIAMSQITRMQSVYGQIRYVSGQAGFAVTAKPVYVQWKADGTQSVWK